MAVSMLVGLANLSACGGDESPGSDRTATTSVTNPSPNDPSMTPGTKAEGDEVGPEAAIGETFVNGSFEVTVTKVRLGVKLIDLDETAKSGGWKGYEPENGQFVMVLETKNVSNEPDTVWGDACTMTDSRGKTFNARCPYLGGALGRELYDEQAPDREAPSWLAMDVPLSVTKVDFLTIQTDAELGTGNPTTRVQVG